MVSWRQIDYPSGLGTSLAASMPRKIWFHKIMDAGSPKRPAIFRHGTFMDGNNYYNHTYIHVCR
jgi:hypothetical protein